MRHLILTFLLSCSRHDAGGASQSETSKAARDAKMASIASRSYVVDNAAYETYFSASALSGAGVDSYAQSYALAMATLDTEVAPIEGEPQPNVSFFADATDLI